MAGVCDPIRVYEKKNKKRDGRYKKGIFSSSGQEMIKYHMEFSQKTEWWIGTVVKIMLVGIGIIILGISMARAGWESRANNDNDDIKGNNLVEFTAVFDNGTTAVGNYKLPETGMLPDNIFYGMKEIRNDLWVWFSKGQVKTKMVLLLADKSAAEGGKLIDRASVHGYASSI